MVTRLVADLLGELNLNVREIHSRKPQSYRTRVSDEFRKSKGLILVTSDVSARGVDYPDVSLVVQVIYLELLPCFTFASHHCDYIISLLSPIPEWITWIYVLFDACSSGPSINTFAKRASLLVMA
jgi:hypothetical protein